MSPDDVMVRCGENPAGQDSEKAVRAAERHLVSRELHDTTSQLLVALHLQLEELRRTSPATAEPLVDEMAQAIQDIHSSIRKIGLGQSDEDEDARAAQVKIARMFYSLGAVSRSA